MDWFRLWCELSLSFSYMCKYVQDQESNLHRKCLAGVLEMPQVIFSNNIYLSKKYF